MTGVQNSRVITTSTFEVLHPFNPSKLDEEKGKIQIQEKVAQPSEAEAHYI
jgi:hypothetical protein